MPGPISSYIGEVSTIERTGFTPEPEVWKATGLEPQVFLDRSGRRARRVSVAGVLAAVLGASWLGGIVGGSAGFASLPALRSGALVAHAAPRHVSHRSHARHGRAHVVELADVAPHRG
jgi:hypothetical protein